MLASNCPYLKKYPDIATSLLYKKLITLDKSFAYHIILMFVDTILYVPTMYNNSINENSNFQ